MLKTRVIPCLLLKNNGLVKTIGFKNPRYLGDPINTVKIFNEKEVDELVFLDIMATVEKKEIPFKLLSEIASECFMPLGYGGGIRSIEDIKRIFNIGVEKVIINTFGIENPNFLKEASNLFGSQSIVGSIDVKKNLFGKYEVFSHGGRNKTGSEPVAYAKQIEKLGVGEILLNSIDQDGKMKGYDLDLIGQVSKAVDIPVIACGGAGKIEDLASAVYEGGASAAAAGSIFVFQGKHHAVLINYPDPRELEKLFNR